MNADGCSWIKKDGNGSRKNGNRIPFSLADVVKKTKEGEEQPPLQKGDHVEYRAWRDSEGRLMAVRVERARERPRVAGGGGGGGGGPGLNLQRRTDRATQAHFRMAVGPEEGKTGFGAGRGRPISAADTSMAAAGNGGDATSDGGGVGEGFRRPRGSSMGGPDSKVFVPSSAVVSQFEDAD